MTNGKNIGIKILLLIFLMYFVFTPVVFAIDTGLDEAAKKGYGVDNINELPMTRLPDAIGKVIGIGLSLIGIVFLILMIYGGFTWMIARGNEADVTKSKELIQAAIIGLVIVVAAYAITNFVGQQLL